MGRLLALALLFVFSSELIQPLLVGAASVNPEEQLPACCRRNGKHGCSMSRPRTDQPAVRGVCSEYQVRKGAPAAVESALLAAAPVAATPLQAAAAPTTGGYTVHLANIARTHSGRGPPSA